MSVNVIRYEHEGAIRWGLCRAGGVLPGTALRLTNFPKYSGSYMINTVSYPLTDDGVVTMMIAEFSALLRRWEEVPEGGVLELEWP